MLISARSIAGIVPFLFPFPFPYPFLPDSRFCLFAFCHPVVHALGTAQKQVYQAVGLAPSDGSDDQVPVVEALHYCTPGSNHSQVEVGQLQSLVTGEEVILAETQVALDENCWAGNDAVVWAEVGVLIVRLDMAIDDMALVVAVHRTETSMVASVVVAVVGLDGGQVVSLQTTVGQQA